MAERELAFNSKKRKVIRYATKKRMEAINSKNIRAYEQYRKSRIVKNKDVESTTYKMYKSAFNIFLCFIAERWDNFYILDEEFLDDEMVDVMEDFIVFLDSELGNKKHAINFKLSAVSSFYQWAVKRRKLKSHPFEGRLERMKNAHDEKVIAEYYLEQDQIEEIVTELSLCNGIDTALDYDMQDRLIWHIAFDSACRIGALSALCLSKLELDKRRFKEIREKRGKRVSIPFTAETGELIEAFLEYRKKLGVDCDEFFFVKVGGEWRGMSAQSLSKRIKRIGYIVGLGDFRPHCIRKSRLNQVAEYDINLAKTLANHESLDTTSRFYTKKKDQTDTLDLISQLQQGNKG